MLTNNQLKRILEFRVLEQIEYNRYAEIVEESEPQNSFADGLVFIVYNSKEEADNCCLPIDHYFVPYKSNYTYFTIEEMFIAVMDCQIKENQVFDENGYFKDDKGNIYEKYCYDVANAFMDGDLDLLDRWCNENQCFPCEGGE